MCETGQEDRVPRRLRKPIFVVGCCNSGTTILWHALLLHPELSGPPVEGQDLKEMPRCMTHFLGRQTSRLFAHSRFKDAYRLTEGDYDPAVAEQLDAVYAEYCGAGKRFVEKSPANSVRTRFLQSIYPDAHFVMVVRNGLAVAEGIRRKRLFDPQRPHLAGLATTIGEAAEQWRNANRILLEDLPYLRRCTRVTYEDLVLDPARTLRNVTQDCGCEHFEYAACRFDTHLNEAQIARLTQAEQDEIRETAGEMLRNLGYVDARGQ